MYASLAVTLLVTSAVVTPDETLIESLGSSRYVVREWAHDVLIARATKGFYPTAVTACYTACGVNPNPEINARVNRIISGTYVVRLRLAYATLDRLTGRHYPCVDALIYNQNTGQYAYPTSYASHYSGLNGTANDPVDVEFVDPAGEQFHSFRVRTRVLAAQALADGWELSCVMAELDRMRAIDAMFTSDIGINGWVLLHLMLSPRFVGT